MSDIESFYSASETSILSNDGSFESVSNTLGETLSSNFNSLSNGVINICHINAQSVPSHFNDMIEAFTGNNIHAILISESWFKSHLLSTSYALPGYVLIRNDRIGRRGGGVAIYLRSNLRHKMAIIFSLHPMCLPL